MQVQAAWLKVQTGPLFAIVCESQTLYLGFVIRVLVLMLGFPGLCLLSGVILCPVTL